MTVEEAKQYVAGELARIERENPGKELRPWMRDACPAALEHWGLIQQRIALSQPRPYRRACCKDLNLTPPERKPASPRQLASMANARLGLKVSQDAVSTPTLLS
jgi:hypothetical protein